MLSFQSCLSGTGPIEMCESWSQCKPKHKPELVMGLVQQGALGLFTVRGNTCRHPSLFSVREKGNGCDGKEGFHPSPVPCSSCGCEKSHVGLCSSDLVTPTPSPEGYKSLRQAQLLSSDNCQSNCVLRLLFVPPGMSCLAIDLKRGQWKLKGTTGGTPNSTLVAKSPENVFSCCRLEGRGFKDSPMLSHNAF